MEKSPRSEIKKITRENSSEEELGKEKIKNKVKIDTIETKNNKKQKSVKKLDQFEINRVVELNDNNGTNVKSKKRVKKYERKTKPRAKKRGWKKKSRE